MSLIGVDRAGRVETVVPEVTGWQRLLRPPEGLLARVRWLFLAASVALALILAPGGAAFAARMGLSPIPPLLISLALGAVWLYAFGGTRERLPWLATDVLCAAGIAALGATMPDTRIAQFALYLTIWNRALRQAGWPLVVSVAILLAAFFGGATQALSAPSLLGAAVLGAAVVGAIFAATLSIVGTVLGVYERAVARERRLRAAGHALAEAKDRESIYAATISGARELLAGIAEYGVELAVGTEQDMTIVGEAGEGTAASHGAALHSRDLPEALRRALHDGTPLEVAHADPTLWRALDFAPRTGEGTVYGLPLVAHGRFEGAIVVGSHDPLDAELKDDLQTLGDLTALALESQLLLEARAASAAGTADTDGSAAALSSPFERARSTAAVPQAAPPQTPLWQIPHDLPQRVRWTFLLTGLVVALWVSARAAGAILEQGATPFGIVAALSPLWLGAWWLYGYRRGDFPLVGDVVVAALLLLTVASTPEFIAVQPVLITAVWVRATYGSRQGVAIFTVLAIAAFLAAPLLAPGTGAASLEVAGRALLPVALVLIATLFHFVAETLGRYERALARERALRVAGALLVAATDRPHVYAATLDGAAELLRGTPGASAVVGVGSPRRGEALIDSDDMEAVAATGAHAAHTGGKAIHLSGVSETLRTALHAGDVVDLPRADAATWQALDLEGQPGALYAAPLHVRGALEGAIVVGSDVPLDAELKDDLQTLSALAALAIEDIVLLEATPA